MDLINYRSKLFEKHCVCIKFNNSLHHIVLGINNLEMVLSIQEDVHNFLCKSYTILSKKLVYPQIGGIHEGA